MTLYFPLCTFRKEANVYEASNEMFQMLLFGMKIRLYEDEATARKFANYLCQDDEDSNVIRVEVSDVYEQCYEKRVDIVLSDTRKTRHEKKEFVCLKNIFDKNFEIVY